MKKAILGKTAKAAAAPANIQDVVQGRIDVLPEGLRECAAALEEIEKQLGAGMDLVRGELRRVLKQSLEISESSALIKGDVPGAFDKVDKQQEEVELISNPAITFAIQVAEKVYGDRFEGKSLPPIPSVEQVAAAFARNEQKMEIAGRTEPTLRFVVVGDGDVLRHQPIILDGAQEMPLETYENKDVYDMTREQRVLTSRELNENPDIRKELDEDMILYDLLSYGASMQGKPIDQTTRSMLTAQFKKGDEFVRCADWVVDQSFPGKGRAYYVSQDYRLRFAVWGDVIS